jgi:hypothetical protein
MSDQELTWGMFIEIIKKRTVICEMEISKECSPNIHSVLCRHCYQFEKALQNGEKED